MQERNKNSNETPTNDPGNNKHGAQGVDKAPGEDPAVDNINFKEETQKSKKTDADPSKESDRPAEQKL